MIGGELKILTRMPAILAGIMLASAGIHAYAGVPEQSADKKHAVAPDAMRHMAKGPDVDIERLRDPFASYLGAVARRRQRALAAQRSKLARHRHEALEDFDLSTLKLVAIMRMGENRVAMVEDSAGKGYIVRRGNYMGKNNGRIKKITDNSVLMVEQAFNPAGDLVNRNITLTLKEVNQ